MARTSDEQNAAYARAGDSVTVIDLSLIHI